MHARSPTLIAVILAGLAALAPFAIDTYLPAFPAIERDLGASTLQLQQSLTAYLLPYALMTLWHGAISDAIGRLTAIRYGLIVFSLASVGCALAPDAHTLLFFRVIQGVSSGAGNVVARAMVRDLFEGVAAQRVMAQVQMIFGLAPAVAPIIGGLLLGIHWQAIFVFLGIYGLLALTTTHLLLPETLPPEKRVKLSMCQLAADYRKVFGNLEFLRLITAFGANFSGFFVYVLAAPVFLMRHLGLSSHQFGYMFIPTVSGMVLGSYLARRAAGKLASGVILRIAYGLMASAALANIAICLWLPPSTLANIAPIAFYNVGMALAIPILSIAALDRHPRLRGTAASAQAFLQMLLSTLSAGLIIPLFWDHLLGLALCMSAYLVVGWYCVRATEIWRR